MIYLDYSANTPVDRAVLSRFAEMKVELAELKAQKAKGELQIQDTGSKKGKKLKKAK